MKYFSNLKVLELANVLAGPSVGMFLAELGAEVIKVENPATKGDVTRSWKLSSESADTDTPAYFCAMNWGKKSICLSFTDANDRRILEQLIQRADVMLSSFKPGDDLKFKLDFESLKQLNPNVLLAEITAYGKEDARVGYDAILQAESGFTFLNGNNTTDFHKMPVALIDVLAGHQLKEGILAALLENTIEKKARHISVSLLETALSSLANQATNYLTAGINPQPAGSEHPNIVPYGTIFKCADAQPVVVAIGTNAQFGKLCEALGVQALSADDRFATNPNRVKNRIELNTLLKDAFEQQPATSLLEKLHASGVPAGSVNTVKEAVQLPQAANILLKNGDTTAFRTALFSDKTSLTTPPHLDENREEILNLLG